MERFTISLSESLAKEFDELIRKKGYQNRSEAVRDMLRDLLKSDRLERQEAPYCVAALSYVYNHHARDLAERLTNLQHQHHHLVLSTMHVHLDHDNCLETLMLRGETSPGLPGSSASTEKLKTPAAAGFPVRVPSDARASPGGSAPEAMLHVEVAAGELSSANFALSVWPRNRRAKP